MFGLKRKAMAAALSAAVLAAAVVPGLTPGALDNPPSTRDPFGMTAYVDELFEGKKHDWAKDNAENPNPTPSQDDLLGDYPWRAQYYDSNPEWDGFYSFKFLKTDSWSDKIDVYMFGSWWNNDTGQVVFESGIPYLKTKAGEVETLCLTFTAPKDGNYKIYPNSALSVVRLMYPKYFPGGSDYNDGHDVPASSTLKLGFAIHKMAGDADLDTFDPAGETKLWPTDKEYEYLTKDNQSFAFPTLENVPLKAGEKLRFIVDRTGTEGIADWLVSAALYPMVANTDNTPPTAGDGAFDCTIGRTVSGQLAGADADEGAVLTYSLKTEPQKGSVVVNEDGTFTYTPGADVEGTDTFVYTVTDENNASADGTVTITFVSNKAPAAGTTAFSTLEDTALEGALNPTDEDEDAVTVTLKTDAAHGELALNEDGTFTYTPEEGFFGEDTFVVTLADGKTTVDVTVTVTVEENKAPVANAQTVKTKPDTAVEFTLGATDANAGTTLTYKLTEEPAHGTAVLEGDKVTYTPEAGFSGLDSLTFQANDGVNDSEPATVTLAVLDNGLDSMTTIKDAIEAAGEGRDKDKAFEFFEVYDLPWQFQYRIEESTGDIDDINEAKFETAVAATIHSWGGFQLSDGTTWPSTTIQNAGFLGNQMVHVLNSGWLPDEKNAVAALAFVAPKDATYFITGGEVTDQFGIWEGQATANPIKVWIEVDGTMVWPANGQPLALSTALEKTTLPDLQIAMKEGAALRFCVQGTTLNVDNNNVYLDPVAYELGAYDEALDPVEEEPAPPVDLDPEDPEVPTDPGDPTDPEDPADPTDPEDPGDDEIPDTGVALPLAALMLAAGAGVLIALSKRKKEW